MSSLTREIGGHTLDLSNPDKVFFPDAGVTKGDIVDYYERVADTMLPHVRDRFVSMHRWPDGIEGEDFYQKNAPDYFPDWIRTEKVEKEGGTNRQVVVDDAATLVYLADQACVTPHIWLSRTDSPRYPDRMVFDFDPSGDWEESFDGVRWAARRLRDVLGDIGLESRVMTSGSRGLHVHVALDAESDFDAVKQLSRDVAELLAGRYPDRLTTKVRKKERADRIFIDYLRNEYAQTTVAPYAVRARPGAPVATPVDWDELSGSGMGPRRYTVRNVFRRLGRKSDPWRDPDEEAQSLEDPREALDDLRREDEG
jgi:bifunctional non-homologous end joining protein LigD